MRFTPDSDDSPAAAMTTATGDATYQPAEQVPALHWIDVVGALESAWAVKPVGALEIAALFCAVTEPLCVPALLPKV
jgi:hypothetical protein